jgi:hypothetical protein
MRGLTSKGLGAYRHTKIGGLGIQRKQKLERCGLPFPKKALQLRRSNLQAFRYVENNQNKYEIPVAKKLRATLTRGSGSVFRDGDMRLAGKFLIEHKYRSEDPICIPLEVFQGIQKKACSRNLTPILIVSSSTQPDNDIVVMRSEDAFCFYPDTISTVDSKQWKQIHVDFRKFLECRDKAFSYQYGIDRHIPVHKTEVKASKSYYFTLSHLSDFKKYIPV